MTTARLRRIEGKHNALVKELREAFARGELTASGECAMEGVLIGEGTVSAYNSKTVRASAGSAFRLMTVRVQTSEALGQIRARGFRLLATSSHKGESLAMADLASKVAIFIGNEGAGLDKKLLAQMDGLIMIPHSERVESLNAGIA